MNKIKKFFGAHKIFKIFMWVFLISITLFVVLITVRTFHYFDVQKTNAQVLKIHSTKLLLSDATNTNLPSDPGVEGGKTIQGIDANTNGIRDDVEIAIYKEYPNSAKTRAVLLQYALVLQMETIQPFLNEEIATATAEKESQSYDCIGEIVPRSDNDIEKIENYRNFIKDIQLNTTERKNMKENFDNKTRSFELKSGCDIDLSKLVN